MLDVDNIRIDGGTQARSELNEAVVQQYADAISAGETFPPIITFFDGTDHWIADGFHRLFAHKKLELVEIDAEIRSGTRRDAVLFSVGANRRHGLPASNADKRKAVQTLLDDAEWAQWSDREIARQCGVSAPFVGGARKAICKPFTDTSRTVERNGKTYEQQTSNIGRNPIPTPTEQRIKQICAEERRNVEAEDKQSRQDSASWKADVPEDEGPSAAEVAASEAAEQADRALINKLLEEDDKLAFAVAECKRLAAENDVLQQRVNGLMNEKNEIVKLLNSRNRQIAKLEAIAKGAA